MSDRTYGRIVDKKQRKPQVYTVGQAIPRINNKESEAIGRESSDSTATDVAVTSESEAISIAKIGRFYFVSKRAIDFVGALLGLVLLFPLLLVLAVLVYATSRGPIFHRRRVLDRQVYTGGSLRTFDAFKFRTMKSNADAALLQDPMLHQEYQKEYKLAVDPRVTPLGRHLRRLSLDELPQLLNVLRGQMSLVGPRMITPAELPMYGTDAAKLLTVKPAITGLWQVSGRTNISYRERVRLDMWYIDNRSLRLDLEILVRTVGCVLSGRGAV